MPKKSQLEQLQENSKTESIDSVFEKFQIELNKLVSNKDDINFYRAMININNAKNNILKSS